MSSLFTDNAIITETLRDYIDRKLVAYGSPEYAYTVVHKKNPSNILIISSYPDEWVDIYRASNLHHIDPVVLTAFRRTSPFSWDENITLMSDLKLTKIFSMSKKYNIVNGYTFVLHDHMNNLALLSLIIDNNVKEGLEDNVVANRNALQMLLIEINEQMHMLNRDASPARQSQREAGADKAIFSPRENEILYWASMGKTYAEIAVIAGISTRTVKFHMGNVVSKLGVNNARQAIRLGVELELIKPELS
ncbi:LuxR family transcriptional regulator [Paramixta manurensis]|uniref:LuxR family transcriptional regulator n=1 Tax=Paramixta manurensis TaxID=2740817 RepID=A0A6M8U8N9_9GAMM|nr:LuxR family transcriptional regulator [Erwiniaceae bacterium PD-1]